MPAAVVAPRDRAALLDALRAAGLLSPAQLAKAQAVAGARSAADAAGALVAAGLLTRFQADRLLAGRTDGFVLGPYVVLEQIGRGARSRVYRAKHRTMHRPVALKVLAAELTDTPARREAVRAAVRSAGRLAHPNIVTAYDADERHDRFYLVLELVDGPDLGALVAARGPLPVAEACEFVRQIAAGLAHAHDKGMVHRDLKPENLLVARPTPAAPPTVKIADFGLPRASTAVSAFAAPEQFSGAKAGALAAPRGDHRADLYALGRVFYFLLTGRAGREALPLVQLRPDVPPEVGAIVHRLLAPNPADRFGSAAELLVRLDAACVPVAIPLEGEGAVTFDPPAHPLQPGRDSGYLTGRVARPAPRPPADPGASPWAEIVATAEPDGATVPYELDETPAPPPRKAKAPGHGEPVPAWLTAGLLVGAVLLCLAGIGAAVSLLAR